MEDWRELRYVQEQTAPGLESSIGLNLGGCQVKEHSAVRANEHQYRRFEDVAQDTYNRQ